MAKSGQSHPTELADLFGKRLVVSAESEDNRRLAESLVKQLTGGDSIRARRMREDFWGFRPTHKVILATNHKPVIQGTDYAIWRRLRLVPFGVVIPDDQQDKRLPEKLRAELPGVLAWAVQGCLGWQRDGLGCPDEVRAATAAYRDEQDVIATFLADSTTRKVGGTVKASVLYNHYRQWCESAGETPLSQKSFGAAMTERGFSKFTSNGVRYRDLGLPGVVG
jgi:putative DNA primase/helicase